MYSSSSNINKRSRIANLFTRNEKDKQVFCTVFCNESMNSKVTPWTNSRFSMSFCITLWCIWECWYKSICCQFLVERFQSWANCNLSVIFRSRTEQPVIWRGFSCRNYLVQIRGDGRLYPAALHKVASQTIHSSQVFERWILQNQPEIIIKIKKNWDKYTNKGLFCPKQPHDFVSWLWPSKTSSPRIIIPSWSIICLLHSLPQ